MADTVEIGVQTDPVIITSCRKRPNDGENITEVAKRPTHEYKKSSKTNTVLKLMIPNIMAGAILGKKGEDLINAQRNTGAVAKISKVDEFFPGTNERLCLISGEAESVIEFCNFIIGKLITTREKWPDVSNINNRPQIKLLVSNAAAGVIIGKNGTYVHEIKEKSGVYIQLSQKAEGNVISERCVTLGGTKDQLESAITMIVSAISHDSAFNSLSILNYFASNSQSSNDIYSSKSNWSNVQPVDNYQNNYSVVSMSQTPSISYPLDPKATFTTTSYEQHAFRSFSHAEPRVEKLIEVPEAIIGHILGKGGAALADLKTRTATDIKISKKGVYVPNTTNRWVTISGTINNVDYALRMIDESIQNEERRRSMNTEQSNVASRKFLYN